MFYVGLQDFFEDSFPYVPTILNLLYGTNNMPWGFI